MYAYVIKHNYILGGMLFTICKAQLYVLATNVGHLQVVQCKLIKQIYMHLKVVYRVQGGRCKCEISHVYVCGGGAWLWGENIFKLTIGNESVHQDSNDNGVRIVNFAA